MSGVDKRTNRSVPRYQQIAGELRDRIDSGEYRPGDRLPTRDALMSEFGVALNTVASAIALLEQEKRVESHQGVGTFVRTPPAAALDGGTGTDTPALEELAERISTLSDRLGRLEQQMNAVQVRYPVFFSPTDSAT